MSLEICNLFSLYLNSSLYRLYSLANKLAILIWSPIKACSCGIKNPNYWMTIWILNALAVIDSVSLHISHNHNMSNWTQYINVMIIISKHKYFIIYFNQNIGIGIFFQNQFLWLDISSHFSSLLSLGECNPRPLFMIVWYLQLYLKCFLYA